MVIVASPKAELLEANRVIDDIIVVPEGTNLEDFDPSETYGRIMFQERRASFGGIGSTFANVSNRVYFQSGSVKTLRVMIAQFNLKSEKPLVGYKLIVKETLKPAFENHVSKEYPAGHDRAHEKCTHMGAEIYRATYMVPSSSPQEDDLLELDKASDAAPEHVDASAFVNEAQA